MPVDFMRTTAISLPPTLEQRRIVAKSEALLARVRSSRERLDKISVIIRRFKQAVLAAACNGKLTTDWRVRDGCGDAEWPVVVLRDLADLRLGKMLDQAKNLGTPTKYLRNINVRWSAFDLNDLNSMRATQDDKTELSIRDGDLFVCEGGEPGRCAVWNGGETDMIFQKAIHRVRPNHKVKSQWIALNLRNDADSGRLEEYFTGTTIKHLTGKSLARYEFLLPPVHEQQEIVHRAEELMTVAIRLQVRHQKAEAYVNKLAQSILAKAFRGELVPTEAKLAKAEGRSYETAEQLIARIKSERAQPAKNGLVNRGGPSSDIRQKTAIDRLGKRRG